MDLLSKAAGSLVFVLQAGSRSGTKELTIRPGHNELTNEEADDIKRSRAATVMFDAGVLSIGDDKRADNRQDKWEALLSTATAEELADVRARLGERSQPVQPATEVPIAKPEPDHKASKK